MIWFKVVWKLLKLINAYLIHLVILRFWYVSVERLNTFFLQIN